MNRTWTIAALAAVLLLSGCANRGNRLYDWGGYDNLLYQHYKDASKAPEVRASLEAHITGLEANKQKVPPGVYAELGTLYLQANERTKAIDFYHREQDAWPESAGLMKAMIASLERRDQPQEIAK